MEKKITHDDHKGARLSISYGRSKEAPDSVELGRLRAGLEETERTAQACLTKVWSSDPTQTDVVAVEDLRPDVDGNPMLAPVGHGPQEVAECYREEAPGERQANAAHIALNDPTRMLRWVEAVRDVIGYAEEVWAQAAEDDRSMLRGSSGAYAMVLRRFADVFSEATDV